MEDPGQLRYYPLLDSVLFDGSQDEDLTARVVSATSALLVDLIVHQTLPILSQSQIIDSAFVFDVVRDDSTHDAFLGLIADGLVQTRFLPAGLEQPVGEDPFTVLNAFASRLRSRFNFSAWPELNDRGTREDVYAIIRGTSSAPLSGELGERLDALRALDRAFRRSEASEQAQAVVPRERLGARVLSDFGTRPAGQELREMGKAVERLRREAGQDDEGRPLINLDARSSWRSALPEAAARLGVSAEVVKTASDVVDMHYNCVVARSLGAASCADETVVPRIPIGLRDAATPVEFDQRATFLLDLKPEPRVLSWNAVRERLATRSFDSPEVRLEALFMDQLMEMVDGRRLVKVVAATPRRLLRAAHGGALGGVSGYVVGEHMGLLGAVLGGVLGEGLTPDEFLIGGRAAGQWEEMVRSRAVSRLRRSVGLTYTAERA
ncbi:hypothetical protein [Serinicoccus marinus]|uniref:hypothetical protein n=1 Tax=Serinicoccus marinus TaxID=247333 RepID=UPI00122E046C|nr:hypothetical protein [Serinicoccus marinus]